ncbi:MAG TPA: lysophospholipid acyltransferase family protein [Pyrinomonadaceae bacterium]|nr:lysophospholipid acyltransferase family protein [Pyrinomonadaceae bacterium]
MALRQKGNWTRRLVHLILSIALRLFFRRIEIGGARNVPTDEPLIFVSNHPNGLIDPALIFCALPRRISFLAKSTLFRIPVIKFLVNAVESLPLYRRVDTEEDVSKNRLTFERCHALLKQNRCIALFPEGVSHNSTRLLPVKTGAARIALGAISVNDNNAPEERGGVALDNLKIVPVGLYYTSKTSFRSEALIRCGAPIEVRAVSLDERGEPPREAVRELSARIEAALLEVTLNVEDDEELGVVSKAQELFSSLYETLSLRQTLSAEFDLRRRIAEKLSGDAGQDRDALRRRILQHEEELDALGINAENLSLLTDTRWNVFRHFLLRGALVLLLLPLSVPGALLHLPAFIACEVLSRLYRRHGVDEIAPTVKILAAIGLMPLTWLVVSALAYFWWGWRTALLAFPTAIACGYAAMLSLETLYDMRGWFKGVLLLFNQRQRVLRLFLERRTLHQEMKKFVEAE